MDKNEIFSELKNILVNDVQVNFDITPDTALLAGAMMDSMDFMSYVTFVEEKFNLKISDEDITNQKLGIMKNMTDYISQKTNG